jgi:hypothetical protein
LIRKGREGKGKGKEERAAGVRDRKKGRTKRKGKRKNSSSSGYILNAMLRGFLTGNRVKREGKKGK